MKLFQKQLLGSSFKSSKLHRVPSIVNLAKKYQMHHVWVSVKHWLVPGYFQYFTCDSAGFFVLAMSSKQEMKPALGWADVLNYVTSWSHPPLMVPHLCHQKSKKLIKIIAGLFFTWDATTTARNALFLLKLSEGPWLWDCPCQRCQNESKPQLHSEFRSRPLFLQEPLNGNWR